jgi:hypothetical protein
LPEHPIGTSACCRHPDHYRRVRRAKAEATVERGSPNFAGRPASEEDMVMRTRVFADAAAAIFKAGSDPLLPLLDVP